MPVLAKGKTRTGGLWTYVRDDRPFAGPDPPAAVYSPARGGVHPEQHLAGYAGLMQTDAYAGFSRLYQEIARAARSSRLRAGRTAGASFFDLARLSKAPIEAEAVKRVDVLVAIEREINGLAAQERLRVGQERSCPLIVELEAWLRQQRALQEQRHDQSDQLLPQPPQVPIWRASTSARHPAPRPVTFVGRKTSSSRVHKSIWNSAACGTAIPLR
nr:hypothetical 61.7 kDa protein y4HP [Bradyrhizobium sp. DOA9]